MSRVSKHKGINLIELMVVVAIVGILASIGYPLYTDQVEKTRRTDGKAKLLEVLEAQERIYSARNTYFTTLTTLGYPVDINLPTDEGFYQVSAAACLPGPIALTQCINLSAAPIAGGPQATDGCGTLSIDSRGNKVETGPLTLAQCW